MSDTSVSWIGLALSALLVLDKLLSKSKKIKCKCCGSEFEASESLSTPMTPKQTSKTDMELGKVKVEHIQDEPIKTELIQTEAVNKTD